jgi:phospholipid/cholesterol/gamma-HCH transport system substrate-binding protein
MPNERTVRILTGAISLVLFSTVVYFGLKVTGGAFRPVYYLSATFDTAGQGLDSKSDVKVHGMDIGSVTKVTLVNGRAQIKLRIDKGQRVPVGSRAVIRPKTLFGEKFVDIDPGSPQHEANGPFLKNGDRITNTLGGFELEQVLGKAYPVLKDVRPDDLTVVLDTLARGGQGEGPAINRQLANWKTLAAIGVAHDAETRQFLDDFALLSDELANRSGDLVAMAKSLNSALPPLNQRGDEVASVLANLSRLSNDFADVLDNNRPFQDKAVLEGGQTLGVLSGHAGQIGPLLVGIREYVQFQAIVGHIPYGNGSNLAAVKLIAGGGSPVAKGAPARWPDRQASRAPLHRVHPSLRCHHHLPCCSCRSCKPARPRSPA